MIKTMEKNGNFRYLVDTRKSAKGVSHGDRKVFKTLDEAKTYEKMKNKEYKFWFEFVIGKKKKYDYFSIEYENGKIKIIGNTGVSVAAGLNH